MVLEWVINGLKSPYEELVIGYEASKFNTDVSHVTKPAKKTISEEIGDNYPVYDSNFAPSAQSAETPQNALRHSNQKR